MVISSIRLQNYRSYKDKEFVFSPAINVISGPNACGKTNLLEAIYLLAQGSSFRSKDSELVRHKADWARLDGVFDKQNRSVKIVNEDAQTTKEFDINTKTYKRLSHDKKLPVVLFEPNHILSLTRGPDKRRDLIDNLLAVNDPAMSVVINRYKKILAQRNALLKQSRGTVLPQVFVWDIRLAETGQQIAVARQAMVDMLNKDISDTYSAIAARKTKLRVNYQSQFGVDGYASRMISRLKSELDQDNLRGFTSSGPHREDFEFMIGLKNMNEVASRGEARSIILALKICETDMIVDQHDQKPIIILDDVFSELDNSRRKYLMEAVKDFQCFISTTDGDHLKGYLGKNKFKAINLD